MSMKTRSVSVVLPALFIALMPCGLGMQLDAAEVSDQPAAAPLKIVALGSSTTAPRGSVKKVYCRRLAELLLARGIPAEIVNSGIGGSTTEHSRARFKRDVLDHDPDLVVIMLGGNDSAVDVWKKPPATGPRVTKKRYAENLHYFIKTLKARGAKVILMAPPPFRWTPKLKRLYGKPPYDVNDPWGFSLHLSDYCRAVRAVAREEGVPLVDVFKAFLEYDRGEGQSVDDLLLDGMHPNDEGHRIVAELLAAEIVKINK